MNDVIPSITISSKESVLIKNGVMANIISNEIVTIPKNAVGILGLRKSIAKDGLMIGSTIIESDYQGHITIQIFNASEKWQEIRKGDVLLNLTIVERAVQNEEIK